MLQAVGRLITSRRNFLIRASAITAAGATVAVPIIAVETPEQRIKYHLQALKSAFADHYGTPNITARWGKSGHSVMAMVVASHDSFPKSEATVLADYGYHLDT